MKLTGFRALMACTRATVMCLTGDGIGLSYDVYELASYAEGATDIVIPFEEFRMMEDFYRRSD